MTKFIVYNRTDAWKADVHLFFTITNCEIVRPRSLTHRINYNFMCISACWQWKLGCVPLGWSGSKICLDHGVSKEPVNAWPEWIRWFLWCTMIQTTPKERTLSQWARENFCSYHKIKFCASQKLLLAFAIKTISKCLHLYIRFEVLYS